MRKPIVYLLLLAFFSCSKPNKLEGLILKVQYQPDKTYSISTIRGTETVITYSGEDIAMQQIKSKNIKNPTISKVKTKTDAELVTEKSSTGTSFPVILTYKRIMSLDGKNQIPEGTVVQGEVIGEELPTFSKVVSGTLDSDQKERLLQTVQSNFGQLDFPEQRLKIGDQFSADRTVAIPMEGSVIELVVTTTYKLLSIKDNMAEFELSQNYQMTPKMMDNSFTGSGNGKGQLSYDIANFLVTDYSIKTELEMNKKLNYFEFDLKTINEFSQQTKLVTN
ncbi:MAG: hypothetical protein Q8P34_15090 [Bacteroidota bacterium]|nr:hypothetical protein [Bacteroidota bacterium]